VPSPLIVASILAVNFRHVLYSAAIAPYIKHFSPLQKFFTFFLLVDPQFAELRGNAEFARIVARLRSGEGAVTWRSADRAAVR